MLDVRVIDTWMLILYSEIKFEKNNRRYQGDKVYILYPQIYLALISHGHSQCGGANE